jgi:hypothetical protein
MGSENTISLVQTQQEDPVCRVGVMGTNNIRQHLTFYTCINRPDSLGSYVSRPSIPVSLSRPTKRA